MSLTTNSRGVLIMADHLKNAILEYSNSLSKSWNINMATVCLKILESQILYDSFGFERSRPMIIVLFIR